MLYARRPGTADSSDYVHAVGTVDIPAGAQSAAISIHVVGDTRLEFAEQFYVDISEVTNSLLWPEKLTATVTILPGDRSAD